MPATIRIEAIIPKIPKFDEIYNEIRREMYAEGKDTVRMFEKFFQTWSEKPVSTYRVVDRRQQGYIYVDNFPIADEGLMRIIRYVIFGTTPHIITPRGDYPMVFPSGDTFLPKTQPGVIQSQPGFPGGPGIVRTYYVQHPGNAPRGTLAQINQERRNRVFIRLGAAFRRGLAKAQRMGTRP